MEGLSCNEIADRVFSTRPIITRCHKQYEIPLKKVPGDKMEYMFMDIEVIRKGALS